MPNTTLEEIEATRQGEKSVAFAALKGGFLNIIKEGLPLMGIAAIGGTIAGFLAWGAAWATDTITGIVNGADHATRLVAGAIGGNGLEYVGFVGVGCALLAAAYEGWKGGHKEMREARRHNRRIERDIYLAKKIEGLPVSKEIPSVEMEERQTPKFVQNIVDQGPKSMKQAAQEILHRQPSEGATLH